MVYQCTAFNCFNTALSEGISLHNFPKDEKLVKEWLRRIRRREGDFDPAKNKVCSAHFLKDDFFDYYTDGIRRLKPGVKPIIQVPEPRKSGRKRAADSSSDTETASEIDEETESKKSVKTQTSIELPCTHPFSLEILRSICQAGQPNTFQFYTGFNDYEHLMKTLTLLVPDLKRPTLPRCDTKAKHCTELMESDPSSSSNEETESEDENRGSKNVRDRQFKLEDEFLMVLMKLRMGLKHFDLACRFLCSIQTVTHIFTSWINFLYQRLESLEIWPSRDVILESAPGDFRRDYPSTIAIIDCVELKVRTPSIRLKQKESQPYSNNNSNNTFKCLLGTDARGSIVFISPLYTDRISNREICHRSGFFDLLEQKLSSGALHKGDAIMADKKFMIEEELRKLGLKLSISPFLKEAPYFLDEENFVKHSITHHCSYIDATVEKIRNYSILERKLPISMWSKINQIWCVCALISNYQDPCENLSIYI